MRTCVGCRRRAPSHDLVRVRRTERGDLAVGAGAGRGVWLCAPPAGLECLDEATRRRALPRALRASIVDAEVARLRARLEGLHDG